MFAPIETLIPHRSPLRWVEKLIACTETTATATTCFTESHFAVANEVVLESALVECMAQTVAAALGHRLRAGGSATNSNQGMLAAVSNFKIHRRPPLNQLVTIEVQEVKRLGPMLLVAGRISAGSELIATGDLSLYA